MLLSVTAVSNREDVGETGDLQELIDLDPAILVNMFGWDEVLDGFFVWRKT